MTTEPNTDAKPCGHHYSWGQRCQQPKDAEVHRWHNKGGADRNRHVDGLPRHPYVPLYGEAVEPNTQPERTWETEWCPHCNAERLPTCSRTRLIPAFDSMNEYAYQCQPRPRTTQPELTAEKVLRLAETCGPDVEPFLRAFAGYIATIAAKDEVIVGHEEFAQIQKREIERLYAVVAASVPSEFHHAEMNKARDLIKAQDARIAEAEGQLAASEAKVRELEAIAYPSSRNCKVCGALFSARGKRTMCDACVGEEIPQ